MSVMDWFRRLFSPSSTDDSSAPQPGGIAGGESGFAALEDAESAEGVEEETEAPPDLAP